ncbi:MAG: type II toxin-antitoxin system VapC family toxin [Pseudomonadota bacterium]|nr:type II toxin-antitoxin system VapC family toxin [Pseudomonadota bacterium]
MGYVLDACALIAFLRGESGSDVVEEKLIEEGCFAHAVNLCEVYYDCIRVGGEDQAESLVRDLLEAGVLSRTDIDEDFWKDVGRIKAGVARISLADCFAIALATRLGVPVLTSDHHEFDNILARGICAVEFIR